MVPHPRGVYLVTPDFDELDAFIPRLDAALASGPALVQYRNKCATPLQRLEQAAYVLQRCRARGVPLIINDHIDLAVEISADGVHLGGEDGSLAAARAQLGPDFIVGASCYDSIERAQAAAAAGASYVAFGTFSSSPTKPQARRAPLSILAEARALGLPVVAIGGIDVGIAPTLATAGADLLAVISSVFDSPDPARAVHELRAAFELS